MSELRRAPLAGLLCAATSGALTQPLQVQRFAPLAECPDHVEGSLRLSSKNPMKASERVLNGLTALVLVSTLCVVGYAFYGRATASASSDTTRDRPELTGRTFERLVGRTRSADSSVSRSLKGSAHLVYLFATTCQYCEQQRRHMASLLAAVRGVEVVTASGERPELLQGYWADVGGALDAPLSLDASTVRVLGIQTVPTLLFLDREGTVRRALSGTVLDWDDARMAREVAAATR